jgi:hypothetical protein
LEISEQPGVSDVQQKTDEECEREMAEEREAIRIEGCLGDPEAAKES